MGKRVATLLGAALVVLAVAFSGSATPTGGPPSILGDARVGAQLTFTPGVYAPGEGGGAVTQSHVWQLCADGAGNGCTDVQNGGVNYTIPVDVANVGKYVRALETASDTVDPPHVVPSNALGPIDGLPPVAPPGVPAPTGTPAGTQTTLTAHTGAIAGWGGVPPPSAFTYEWACSPGCGAPTTETLTVGPPVAANQTYKVRIVASNAFGSSPPVESPEVRLPFVAAPNLTVGGAPVTVTPGSWPGFNPPTDQWQRCSAADGSGCADVGVAGVAYALQPADAGQFLRVSERTTNGSLNSDAVSNIVGPVNLAPRNTGADGMVLPSITDRNDEVPMRGETLTGSSGVWFAFPAPALVHQWQRCRADTCVNVGDPIAVAVVVPDGGPVYSFTGTSEYVLTDDDLGFTIQLLVTPANGIGNPVPLASPRTAPVHGAPVNRTDLPAGAAALTGVAARGQTLTANSGLWTGFWPGGAPLAVTHEWFRVTAEGDIPLGAGPLVTPLSPAGAATCSTSSAPPALPCTSASVYTLADADLGSTIKVIVTASNPGGAVQLELTSDVVLGAPIVPLLDGEPDPAALPEITGAAVSGLALVGSTGSWSAYPADALVFSYQWLRCLATSVDSCSEIAGAESDVYRATANDVAKRLRVRVTASNGVAPNGVAVSAPTALVASPQPGLGGPGVDLTVQLSTITSGGNATYEVTARNVGTADASGVVVEAGISPQLQLVSSSAAPGSCAGAACNLGSLAAGAVAKIQFAVRAQVAGVYETSISIRSASPDVNPTNNSLKTSTFFSSAGRAPTASNPNARDPNARVAGSATKPKRVPPTLKAMKVKKKWVVDTKFSLLSGAAKLQLTVTEDRDLEQLSFLKGSRLGPARVKKNLVNKKPVTTLTFNAKKKGSFPLRIVLPAKGFALTKSYVIHITATSNGQSSTLDLGFRGAKLVKKKTTLRLGGGNLVASSKFFVPKDKAKVGVKSWLTKGKSAAQLRVLKGSRLGKTITKSARRQLGFSAVKRGRYPVKMILPVKGFAGKFWYTIHVDSRPKNVAWTTYEIRFKASKALLNKLTRAVASAKKTGGATGAKTVKKAKK